MLHDDHTRDVDLAVPAGADRYVLDLYAAAPAGRVPLNLTVEAGDGARRTVGNIAA